MILEPTERCGASPWSPWASWNLRRNPFGEPPPEDLASLVVANVDELVDWLCRPRHTIQFIGHAGRGKSSHLRALQGRLAHVPFVYLGEGEDRVPPVEGRELLLDEAQRLPRARRRLLFQALDWLALSTHEDLTRDLEAGGWTVWTVEVGGLGRERLETVLARRLEWARRGPGPLPRLPRATLDELLRRHGDDLRAILDDLYEATQTAVMGAGAGETEWPSVI